MIDPGPLRNLLVAFERDVQAANRVVLEEEIRILTRKTREEIREGIRAALDQYTGLQYVGENDPSIKSLPPEIRDAERRVRNAPVRVVVRALVFCAKNPRLTGDGLKRMQNTKFKGWPAHLSIEVMPDLVRFGQTYARLAHAQAQLQADPEPIPDDLMSPAPAPAPQPAETPAVDEPLPEETRIDDE
ncbi:MAG: hypothetical protein PHF57_04910 [Methanoregula sp.]|jgi:hypothetical protein|nr:hypothetical protein [Methanoregula sp.]